MKSHSLRFYLFFKAWIIIIIVNIIMHGRDMNHYDFTAMEDGRVVVGIGQQEIREEELSLSLSLSLLKFSLSLSVLKSSLSLSLSGTYTRPSEYLTKGICLTYFISLSINTCAARPRVK